MVAPMSASQPAMTEQEKRILAGGLPDLAQQRLSELSEAGMTSSFLSVAEAAVAASGGLEPVGQLVGASSCRLAEGVIRRTRGPQGRLPPGSSVWHERDGPIRSWDQARRRALARLSEQARMLGADAVLGVRPELRLRAFVVEVILTGTAVRDRAAGRPTTTEPVLGMVSTVEYGLLRQAGVDVVGIVGSCSSVEVQPSMTTRQTIGSRLTGGGVNGELDDLTEGVYEARRLAIDRLRADAKRLKATGVIGADLAGSLTEHHGFDPHLGVTVQLLGTAVRGGVRRALSPQPVLDMSHPGHD
jgi:uncharacterized protein YbjQ (UPF0145 family)